MRTDDKPLAYRIGNIPFLDTTIFLDSRPLIPRPETEYWVGHAIEEIRGCAKAHPRISVLDLCAGSGCIGVAVLKDISQVSVDFAEIDADHHETIRKNLRENNIKRERARIYGGDLFSEIAKASPQYDFILANPPYIDPDKTYRVQKSVVQYESARALFGGAGGVEYITRIIKESPRYLARAGILYLEHEPEQTKRIHTLAQSLSYTSCETYQDQWQRERYTRLMWAQ